VQPTLHPETQDDPAKPAPPTAPTAGRVLLAAGGTGGHVYPAVALAEALGQLAPEVEVRFCCGARPAELQLYRRLGIEPWILPVSHNRPGLRERMRFVGQMIASLRSARALAREWPADVAVGFGSYVSVPSLLAARMAGARLILHEQNASRMGVANRLLRPLARWVALADAPSGRRLHPDRERVVGNPVRQEMLVEHDRLEARRHFRLGPDRLACLCLGGSQGAVGLNRILLELVVRLSREEGPAGRWQLLWSTGTAHFKEMADAMAKHGIDAEEHALTPYIERMGMAYAAADLVVARAGALTLAELTALGKPAVLIPLPTSKGGHQLGNARRLAESGAAVVLPQNDPSAAEKLAGWLGRWAADPTELAAMAEASRRAGRPGAARALAELTLEALAERAR
jgi:UDP-N-acetylglucosamine--N-acetylmuramyl-(pentapeptide) pyrophosphoryl-undecaprenol N-acetylglucosamine transferase